MKRIIALLLAALLLVSLTACKAKQPEKEAEAPAEPAPETETAAPAEPEPPAGEASQPAAETETVVTPEDLLGSWVLSGENDPEELEAAFPGAKEQGGALQFGMDGLVFWTIGTTGGAGSFTVDGDTLKGEIYLDYSGEPAEMICAVNRSADPIELVMSIQGTDVIWVLE